MRLTAYKAAIDEAIKTPIMIKLPNIGAGLEELPARLIILSKIIYQARCDKNLPTFELVELIQYFENAKSHA